jgi:RNA polymerase sigma factor (sigma-70 family)
MKNVENSQDVTQETFEFLIEKASTLEDKNIKAWLYSVAQIKIKLHNSKPINSYHVSFDDDDSYLLYNEEEFYTIEDAISKYTYNDERIQLEKQKILDSLTDKERTLYEDAYVKKKKYKDIAKRIGVSDKTINVQTFRLRNKIKAIVKGVFEFCFMFLT